MNGEHEFIATEASLLMGWVGVVTQSGYRQIENVFVKFCISLASRARELIAEEASS